MSLSAETIARCAQKALLYEVSVTPKPGLVDRAGNGAHRDMDFFSFVDSAVALYPYFTVCAAAGSRFAEEKNADRSGLLPELREAGQAAELAMYRATGGVNTHKGAVFMLGILTAAAGLCGGAEASDILSAAADIARPALRDLTEGAAGETAGAVQYRKYRLTGARGEAAAGFPAIREVALPILKAALMRGKSPNEAGAETLLQLILKVQDSTLLKRCGSPEKVAEEQRRLEQLLENLPPLEAAAVLDREWSEKGFSAGGCADLLGAAFFLWFLEKAEQ